MQFSGESGGKASEAGAAMPIQLPPSTTQGEVASYVASLSAELASMARQSGLDVLEFVLEMVRLEAEGLNRPEDDKA